ncbi:class F sortase [Streptomyces tsukubensis]|uniref:class F sortase n=1 Tax=Streptomyces tsukubensis TaxID=83656 RepID=UPI00164D42A3|nr:class F sortase [Streptomyces tsukubensis]
MLPPPPPPAHRAPRGGPWFALLCVLLLGFFLVRTGTGAPGTGPGASAAVGPPRPAPAAAGGRTGAEPPGTAVPLPHSPPRRIVIPSLRIDAPVLGTGLTADRSVAPPPTGEPNLAGWYTGSVSPGERGTAVVVGHVDTETGPAVFHPLARLGPGDRIEVGREDGRTAVFTVYGVESLPRDGFPAGRVYRDAPGPELRLITCGGRWSPGAGYEENVVVFARAGG